MPFTTHSRVNGAASFTQLLTRIEIAPLAAGVSIFELSRVLGASVKEIDRTYGHLARDAEDTIRARLDARSNVASQALASE
jgi:hypothetical protein